MNKKKLIFEIIFFLVLTGLTIFYLITSGVFNHISDLKNVSILGIFSIVGVVIIYVLCDSFIIYQSIKKVRGNAHFIDGIGTYALGNLGAGVTPWKSAHFPMIGYYLVKRGYNTEETLSIMARNQMVYSITLPFLYGIFLIYSIIQKAFITIGDMDFPLWVFSFIGIITNIFYFVILMFLLYNKKFQDFIVHIELKVLIKLKKIEDKDNWLAKKNLKMRVYKETATSFWREWYKNLSSIFVYGLFILAINGVPYVVYLALSNRTFILKDYMYCFMLHQAMSYVTNIIPVPGGMAAIEFSFLTVYEEFMGSYVNMAVLLYRFFTYILLILFDFSVFIILQIYSKVKKKTCNLKKNDIIK